jgi:hypothetical protein
MEVITIFKLLEIIFKHVSLNERKMYTSSANVKFLWSFFKVVNVRRFLIKEFVERLKIALTKSLELFIFHLTEYVPRFVL